MAGKHHLTPETIARIREFYSAGMRYWEICAKLGVSGWQIQNYTKDLPKHNRRQTLEQKTAIRKLYKDGLSPYEIAYKLKIPPHLVYSATYDIRVPERRFISTNFNKALSSLVANGYFIYRSNDSTYRRCARLMSVRLGVRKAKLFIGGRHIGVCFVPHRKEAAARAVLDMLGNKVFSYPKLAKVTRLFGVKLPVEEKRKLVA